MLQSVVGVSEWLYRSPLDVTTN